MASYADYQTRLKELRAEHKKEGKAGYIRLRIGGEYLILPYALGLQVLAALEAAERTDAPYAYNRPPKIASLDSNLLEISVLSREEYEDIHMAQLMQLQLNELRTLRQSKGEELPF